MDQLNLVTAAVAGLVSFLSPCVLPLIPGYISFISGVSLGDLQAAGAAGQVTRRAFWSSVWFVLGFSAVFVALGASATVLGALLLQRLSLLRQAAGVVIVILGLHLVGVFRIPFLNYEKKLEVRQRPLSSAGAFLVGAAFAFGWTPCIGPILAGILALASTQESVFQGMLLLGVYSLGLGVPFLATSLGVGAFLKFSARFRRYLRAVEIASGILLIGIGVLIFTDRLTVLARYLSFFNRFAL
ncbi:MAG: cytochrome c biogenesis protein CcdA [Candidatus Omnitrophica bacterium]|nr:cytochrome c biogenesis protein CcdA [Candidatus Omnitrophota bacterium]